MRITKKLKFTKSESILQLDLGTGNGARKPPGYLGVDLHKGPGVDLVVDLRKVWPWKDHSVDAVQSIHLIQQFTPHERAHFINELYRVLKVGGKAMIYTPYWASGVAYGNPANQWPPISEHWYHHLSRAWREQNDPFSTRYVCNFDHTLGYGLHPALTTRSMEYQQHAVQFWKESAQDLCATITKL